jgi:lysyl-tRNA synthetase class 2
VTNPADWAASASWQSLQQRSQTLNDIRRFFHERNVLEVDTPVLMSGGSTDLFLDSLTANVTTIEGTKELYLQTSPEFALKRLLATHGQSIFQIAKCFRDGEAGRRHNPEFTMLEWYRMGFTFDQLIDEVADLVGVLLNRSKRRVLSYREVFKQYLGIDPLLADHAALNALCIDKTGCDMSEESEASCLDLLMSHEVEPHLGRDELTFVYDFPASQAALSKIEMKDGVAVARRFELYVEGSELANGYDELLDSEEQAKRFEQDNILRDQFGKPVIRHDEKLIDALAYGQLAGQQVTCCGVALGIERLLMIQHSYEDIADVMSFNFAKV